MSAPSGYRPLTQLTVSEAAAAMHGRADARWASAPFAPVGSDSRALEAGEFFIALSGENFDGHRFIPGALARGAAGLIVAEGYTLADGAEAEAVAAVPLIRVADPLAAYGELAAWRRSEWGGPVLAISGSAGKTTTRRLLSAALGGRHAVLEPLRNFNNLIGVPHTLLRLEPRHEVAVMELGMNLPGELDRLTQIAQPSAALMTFIGRAHIGMFASQRELVEAKLDLFRACAPGVPFAVNAACTHSLAALPELAAGRRVVQFLGDRPAAPAGRPDVRIARVRPLAPVGYRFDLETPAGTLADLELHLFGRHHLEDVAAAAALLVAAGYDPALLRPALADFHTEALRGQLLELGSMTFLLDCYNAAPDSMLAALGSLGDIPRPRRLVLVLADMLELGDQAAAIHAQMLPPLRALAPDALFGLGPQLGEVCAVLSEEGIAARACATREELVNALRTDLREGDFVFFKGSHGFRLELAAAALSPQVAAALPAHG